MIQSSTISLADTHAAAKLVTDTRAAFLAAPFTGSKDASAGGQLVYYIAGDADTIESVRPILEASSKDIPPCGAIGSATVLKLVTNMVSSAIVGILSEAMSVTAAQGIAITKFQAALDRNAAASGVSKLKVPSMIAADFTPHFSLKNMLKDASFALSHASASGLTAHPHQSRRRHGRHHAPHGFRSVSRLGGHCRRDRNRPGRSNTPGRYGDWRNGALTIQAVKVIVNGSDAFTVNTSFSGGGLQGVATSGLLWESTYFWHSSGGPYEN